MVNVFTLIHVIIFSEFAINLTTRKPKINYFAVTLLIMQCIMRIYMYVNFYKQKDTNCNKYDKVANVCDLFIYVIDNDSRKMF